MPVQSPLPPLQLGMPGGLEILIILVIGIIVFGLPLLIITVVGIAWLRGDGDDYDERIAELESEIARLQAEVGVDESAEGDTGADPDVSGTGDLTDDAGRRDPADHDE